MDRRLISARMQTFQNVVRFASYWRLPCLSREKFKHATCLDWESIRSSLDLVKPVRDPVGSFPFFALLRSLRLRCSEYECLFVSLLTPECLSVAKERLLIGTERIKYT